MIEALLKNDKNISGIPFNSREVFKCLELV
jgi:hypothetical protein